jgi:hypothetical protein
MDHIKRVFSENTGGNCSVDFVQLNDGRIVGINEECIVLYKSLDDFYNCETNNRPIIELI